MKKLFLFSVLALGAMTMSAQITKVGTIEGECRVYTDNTAIGNVVYSEQENENNTIVTLYDNTFDVYKSVTINKVSNGNSSYVEQTSKNFFTIDGKICFLYYESSGTYPNFTMHQVKIIDEDGNTVYDCVDKPFFEGSQVYLIDGNYYLFLEGLAHIDGEFKADKTYIYSLPGHGVPTDLETPTAPARTTNARKVVENGQMYIILDGVKYAVTGSSM